MKLPVQFGLCFFSSGLSNTFRGFRLDYAYIKMRSNVWLITKLGLGNNRNKDKNGSF